MYRYTSTIRLKPYFKKISCDQDTPISLFNRFAGSEDYAVLLESAKLNKSRGRYSFIGFDPLLVHEFPANGKQNPLEELKKSFESIIYQKNPDLPSLQAGFVGYFSYEIVRHFESLKLPVGEKSIPEALFFLPGKLLILDHFEQSLIMIAYSQKGLNEMINRYRTAKNSPKLPDLEEKSRHRDLNIIGSKASSKNFLKNVAVAKAKIKQGEAFQIVLSQKFQRTTPLSPLTIYGRLRVSSPSPYMYLLKFPEFSIIGSSPETLVKVENNRITLCPIAGTRPRGSTALGDEHLEQELLNDPKEKAEHMMLVDLARNDLGRIAMPGSIKVKKLMAIHKFSHVMHMVSEITGTRDPKKSLFEIFQAAFPAGTLTGAPKIRAMEIISRLEKEPRNIYGGAVGYFDLCGNMDFAIAIRTMLLQQKNISIRAGAGIVYDSIPAKEDLECKHKAAGALVTLEQ